MKNNTTNEIKLMKLSKWQISSIIKPLNYSERCIIDKPVDKFNMTKKSDDE